MIQIYRFSRMDAWMSPGRRHDFIAKRDNRLSLRLSELAGWEYF